MAMRVVAMVAMVAVVTMMLRTVPVLAQNVFGRRGHEVVYVRSCPSLDPIERMIEHNGEGQSFKIFFHCLGASRKSDYEGRSYGSGYWA
jgi:hypothetical protein